MNNVVNFKPKPPTIKVELVETNFLTRWPCTVCGGCTEKVPILAESKTGERVCESCLRAGNIDERLEQYALVLDTAVDTAAAATRSLIGRLSVPTYAEWQARYEQYEREWKESYEKETGEKIEEIEVGTVGEGDELPF